jgi:hypothetical protein
MGSGPIFGKFGGKILENKAKLGIFFKKFRKF